VLHVSECNSVCNRECALVCNVKCV
jgi:hypothetical protein